MWEWLEGTAYQAQMLHQTTQNTPGVSSVSEAMDVFLPPLLLCIWMYIPSPQLKPIMDNIYAKIICVNLKYCTTVYVHFFFIHSLIKKLIDCTKIFIFLQLSSYRSI